MSRRFLALYPLLYAALFAAAVSGLGKDAHTLGLFLTSQRILVRALAVTGCFLAMSVFQRGDLLRRAWLFLGWGSVFILLRNLVDLTPHLQDPAMENLVVITLRVLVVLSNLALLSGIWVLARSWKTLAIILPGGRFAAVAVAVVGAVLALAVAGPGAWHSAHALAGGDWRALSSLVSAVADILSLCLIAPLLLTAISLRGGMFAWTWGLVTASQISWLLLDAAGALAPTPAAGTFPLVELFRGMAENYIFAAGVVQFLIIRQVRREEG